MRLDVTRVYTHILSYSANAYLYICISNSMPHVRIKRSYLALSLQESHCFCLLLILNLYNTLHTKPTSFVFFLSRILGVVPSVKKSPQMFLAEFHLWADGRHPWRMIFTVAVTVLACMRAYLIHTAITYSIHHS